MATSKGAVGFHLLPNHVNADNLAELAGPPPGHLPAGMQHKQGSPKTATTSHPSVSQSRTQSSASGYYPATAPTSTGYYTASTQTPAPVSPRIPRSNSQPQLKAAWGDPGNVPRVRYDGGLSLI